MADEPNDRPDTGTDTGTDTDEPEDDETLIDEMRGSGVGVEDPNIVGRTKPGNVEEQVQEDEPPQV